MDTCHVQPGVDLNDVCSVGDGFLGGVAVSIVHTETTERIHVISFRRATHNEEAILFKSI